APAPKVEDPPFPPTASAWPPEPPSVSMRVPVLGLEILPVAVILSVPPIPPAPLVPLLPPLPAISLAVAPLPPPDSCPPFWLRAPPVPPSSVTLAPNPMVLVAVSVIVPPTPPAPALSPLPPLPPVDVLPTAVFEMPPKNTLVPPVPPF